MKLHNQRGCSKLRLCFSKFQLDTTNNNPIFKPLKNIKFPNTRKQKTALFINKIQ